MKKLRIVWVSFFLVAAVVPVGSIAFARGAPPEPLPALGAPGLGSSAACKAIFTIATGELEFKADWQSPYPGQATAEYLLSFPPLTIGFIREVTPTQTQDHGVQMFTATPVSMRFSPLDEHNRPQIVSACTLFVLGHRVQGVASRYGIGQALLPVRLGFEHHRQLNHLLGLELGGRHAV